MIIKFLAAALTGIGGHYLNKRWDKAILFFCLFLLYAAAVSASLYFATLCGVDIINDIPENLRDAGLAFSGGVFGLWLLSIIVTLRDGGKFRVATIQAWTISGVIGALLTTTLTTLCLFSAVVAFNTAFEPATLRIIAAEQAELAALNNSANDEPLVVDPEQGDRQKLAAVALLIDEQLLAEGQALLARVDAVASKGEKALLAGYLYALQGECGQAEEMFAKALVINSDVVISDEYRAGCD